MRCAFYRSWYTPNNAILVVARRHLAAHEVRRLAEALFRGQLAAVVRCRGRAPSRRTRAPRSAVRVEMKSARAAQPSWRRYYLAPSYRAGGSEHAYALQVLAEILGGGTSSRFYRALVLKGVALTAGAEYSPNAIAQSTFGIHAAPKQGVSIATLEAAIDAEQLHRA